MVCTGARLIIAGRYFLLAGAKLLMAGAYFLFAGAKILIAGLYFLFADESMPFAAATAAFICLLFVLQVQPISLLFHGCNIVYKRFGN